MKILFFGDIFGKVGRKGVKKYLSAIKRKQKIDLMIANGENLAHGTGITRKTLDEILECGVDFLTSGNHIFENKESLRILEDGKSPVVRPANMPLGVSGNGYKIIKAGNKRVLIANLIGRVFFKKDYDCPFRKIDEILTKEKGKFDISIVDFHAEATSEKVALGKYLDGRISIFVGTHTHIQTADEKITDKKTVYITDVGMVGAVNSIIGVKIEPIIQAYLLQTPVKFDPAEDNNAIINAILIDFNKNNKPKSIKRINKILKI